MKKAVKRARCRLCMAIIAKLTPLLKACQSLKLAEIELAAIAALQFYTTSKSQVSLVIDTHAGRDLVERMELLEEEMRAKKDIVFDEMHQYLIATHGVRPAGVRLGRIVDFMQCITVRTEANKHPAKSRLPRNSAEKNPVKSDGRQGDFKGIQARRASYLLKISIQVVYSEFGTEKTVRNSEFRRIPAL